MIRLLIADDEKLEREALAELVQRRFEREVVLEVAENGRKAADTAVLWGADLILMDIEMPGMSGLDAARAVLAQRPSCRVIFVTAYSLFQYAHEAVHLGACDYLLKPVDPDELEASVRRAMRQIETERKLKELAAAPPFRDMFGTLPYRLVRTIRMPKHQLSHQTLHAAYHRLALDAWPSAAGGWTLVPYEQLEDYAIPRLLDRYFERIGNSDS